MSRPREVRYRPGRRRFLIAAGAALAARAAGAQTPARRSRLILLGSGGGAAPTAGRSMAGQAVVVDGVPYIVDCGYGTVRQIVAAGIALPDVRRVFLTRQTLEANADFVNLLQMAWVGGLGEALDNWGPPPLKRIVDAALEANAADLEARRLAEGRPAIKRFVWVHEQSEAGLVLSDNRVRISAAKLGASSLAYRFDMSDRSIAFAGAAKPADSLIALARGADLLVHPAYYPGAIDRIVGRPAVDFPGRRNPEPGTMRQHLLEAYASAAEAGRTARAAGVKRLVLTQLQPADDPAITDRMWIDAAKGEFAGEIVVGKDLMEL